MRQEDVTVTTYCHQATSCVPDKTSTQVATTPQCGENQNADSYAPIEAEVPRTVHPAVLEGKLEIHEPVIEAVKVHCGPDC